MPPARNGPDEHPQANDPLRRLVHELEARTRADAARLAELSTLLEHSHVLARRQRLQYEVAGILAQSTTIDDAIPQVLRAIGEIKQWDIVIGWVLEDGTWVQRYEWSVFDPDALSFLAESRACRFESGQGLPDLAIREDKVVWIDDFSAQAGLPRARTAAGLPFNNALVFPLRCGHTHYGAIELIRRASTDLQPGTRDLFESLRSDIGRFIEVRLYETRLREEHARLRRAQRIARLAHWHWNPRTGHLHIDAHSDEILGLNQTDLPTTAAEYLAMVPRDDQDRLIAAFESARIPGEATLEIEHALRHANGEKHIVIVRAEALFDPLGKLLKAHGTIQDITERRREESRTRAVEKRWEAIFRNSPLPAFITDAEIATCLAANEEMLEWLGLPEEAVVGRSSIELGIWSSQRLRDDIASRALEHGYLRNHEVIAQSQGRPRHVLMNVECVELHGRACFLVQFIDITTRKRLETNLKLTATAVEQSAEAIVILNRTGAILTVNPAFTRITGYSSAEAVDRTLDALLYRPAGRHGERFIRRIVRQLALTGHWKGEAWAQRKTGDAFPTLLSLSVIYDQDENPVNHVGVFNDISAQKDYEERLKQLALHDGLTGLPNRSLLMEHLGQALANAQRQGARMAVCFADLDLFKAVNDQYGHDVGDGLLKQVADRFRECLRASDLVARLGGDEFAMILGDDISSDQTRLVAEKIVAAMARPFQVDRHELTVGVSVGIALYPDHATDARLLLRHADEALYHVKETGRNGYEFFSTRT